MLSTPKKKKKKKKKVPVEQRDHQEKSIYKSKFPLQFLERKPKKSPGIEKKTLI